MQEIERKLCTSRCQYGAPHSGGRWRSELRAAAQRKRLKPCFPPSHRMALSHRSTSSRTEAKMPQCFFSPPAALSTQSCWRAQGCSEPFILASDSATAVRGFAMRPSSPGSCCSHPYKAYWRHKSQTVLFIPLLAACHCTDCVHFLPGPSPEQLHFTRGSGQLRSSPKRSEALQELLAPQTVTNILL